MGIHKLHSLPRYGQNDLRYLLHVLSRSLRQSEKIKVMRHPFQPSHAPSPHLQSEASFFRRLCPSYLCYDHTAQVLEAKKAGITQHYCIIATVAVGFTLALKLTGCCHNSLLAEESWLTREARSTLGGYAREKKHHEQPMRCQYSWSHDSHLI